MIHVRVVALILVLASWSTLAYADRAFPECEGSGCEATGGRGGAVIPVTNTNDSGAGSLRACVEATGARTCIFRTGGIITLQSTLRVTQPNLTIAGQTAPGGGILLRSAHHNDTTGGQAVMLSAGNIIWRYTRIRPGDAAACTGGGAECGSGLIIISGAQDKIDIVVDHNSVSWNEDEGIGVHLNNDTQLNSITISWNLHGEPLDSHPTSWMCAASVQQTYADRMTDVDWHHNMTSTTGWRLPNGTCATSRFVNNIIHNWGFSTTQPFGGAKPDFIGNIWERGPNETGNGFHEVMIYAGHPNGVSGTPGIYMSGNIGFYQPDPDGDQWLLTAESCFQTSCGETASPIRAAWRRSTPHADPAYPITATALQDDSSLDWMLPQLGAYRRLDCDGSWIAARDSVDDRIIGYFENATGGDFNGLGPASETEVGGYPTIAAGTPCTDTDNDGMPDVWETAVGSNPNVANNNGTDLAEADSEIPDYYTNLEVYLNGMLLSAPGFASCGLLTPTAGGTPPTQWELPYDVTYGQKVWVECGDMRVILGADAIGEPDASCPVDETGATCDDDLWFAPTAQVRVTGGGQAPRWESVPVVCGVSGGCPSGQGATLGWVRTRGTIDLSAYTLDEVGTVRARYCVDPEADGTCSNGTSSWIVQAFESGGTIAP